MKYNHKLPKLYFDKDADLKWLKDRKVGIIGYGNQGRAQALNLNESSGFTDLLNGMKLFKFGLGWIIASDVWSFAIIFVRHDLPDFIS